MNCDNASNKDTMTEHLELLHDTDGYEFNATEACIRCMPHTVHLSALEVLSCSQYFHFLLINNLIAA